MVEPSKPKNNYGSNRSATRIIVGILLLIPALATCVATYLIPTLRTFWMSLQRIDVFRTSQFIGFLNYSRLLRDPNFKQALIFTLLIVLVRLFVVAVIPLLLAWSTSHFNRSIRLSMRIIFTLSIAVSVPLAIGLSWLFAINSGTGFLFFERGSLSNPDTARAIVLFIDGLYTFGLACGLGLILFLPIWKHSASDTASRSNQVQIPLLVTWGIGMIAVLVLSLNTFSLSYMMTGGGPSNRTLTLGLWIYQIAFNYLQIGMAASAASLIMWFSILLGLEVGFIVLLARLRLSIENNSQSVMPINRTTNSTGQVGSAIVLVITLVIGLGSCILSLLPLIKVLSKSFQGNAFAHLFRQAPVSQALANTIFPSIVTVLVPFLFVYMAAISLGALQPFGKRSEWLLLAFSPWLFVTFLPLSLDYFISARNLNLLGTYAGLFTPFLLSIPALFVLTLFFKGQTSKWEALKSRGDSEHSPGFFKSVVFPSLPLAGVLLLFLFFINWQDLLKPLISATHPQLSTLSILVRMILSRFFVSGELAAALSLFFAITSFLFFIGLVLYQIYYLDRLRIYCEEKV